MQKQDPAIACSVPLSNQETKSPSMANQSGTSPTRRSAAGHEVALADASPPAPEDFEFCVLSSGGLALAGEDAVADMCAADEVFSGGKLLPLRLSSATSGDASSALLLLRSDSGTTTASSSTGGFSSRSSSCGASSSSSSSSCVSRSSSSSRSDPASLVVLSGESASSSMEGGAIKPPRRSVSSSVFYAHPSPSPRPPRRLSAARRSTGSAPAAAWGSVIRLGVVGAPEVYPRRAPGESRRGGSQSARFEQQASAGTREVVPPVDRKLGLGLLGAGLVCSCSPDAVAPVGTAAAAAAAEARRRRKKAEDRKTAPKQSGRGTSRRSRILDWLEELSMPRTKNVV